MHLKFSCVVALIAVLCLGFVSSARAQNPEASLNLSVWLPKSRYLQGEPVMMVVTLRNTGNKAVRVPEFISSKLLLHTTAPDGSKDTNYTGGMDFPPPIPIDASMILQPKSALTYQGDLNVWSVGTRKKESGLYKLSVTLVADNYQGVESNRPVKAFIGKIYSNVVRYEVVSPTNVADIAVRDLLLAALPREDGGMGSNLNSLMIRIRPIDKIIIEYPDSTYTPYIRFFWSERSQDFANRNDYLKIIEDYRHLTPGDNGTGLRRLAELGIARLYCRVKDYVTAKSLLKTLVRQAPTTYASQEAKKLIVEVDVELARQAKIGKS